MATIRYIIAGCFLLLLPFSSPAQELEIPRLGSFQVKRNVIPEMQDMWKRNNFDKINHSLKLPSVTSKNYRTPVNMASVVAGIESSKQVGRNQGLIDNIRFSYGTYQKDDRKGSLKLNNSIHSEINPRIPFGTCVHGNTQRYCNICSPRSRFGNSGFGVYAQPIMGQFYYP